MSDGADINSKVGALNRSWAAALTAASNGLDTGRAPATTVAIYRV